MAADSTTQSVNRASRATEHETAATKRSTAAKKGARTRATKAASARTSSARKRTTAQARSTARTAERSTATQARTAEREARTGFDRVGDVAEKAVLTYVGAALTARDNVVGSVDGLRATYGTRAKAERRLRTDLRRYERRGTTARNALEREVKRTRTRVERELRQRRDALRGVVRVDTPEGGSLVRNVASSVELGRAKAENAVQTGALAGAQAVAKVTERIFA